MTRVWWVAALACGLLACGDDDGIEVDAGEDPVDTGEVSDTFVPGDAGPTVTWELDVRDLLTGDGVPNAVVCVDGFDQLPCTTVATDGTGEIEVPVNLELQLRSNATRYYPLLSTFTSTDETRRVRLEIVKRSNIQPLLAAVGATLDPDKGQLAFLSQSGPGEGLAGVTATLDPMSGEGPYYTMDSIPNGELTATSDDGLGIYTNVDPGDLEALYANPAGDCLADEGWERGPNRVGTRMQAGHLSIIIARCAAPMMDDAGVDAGTDEDAGTMVDAGGMDAGVDGG